LLFDLTLVARCFAAYILPVLMRHDFSSHRHLAPIFAWSMIVSEIRYPFFAIMI